MIISGLDLLLIIISRSKNNTIWGATRLVKLLFLMLFEGGFNELLKEFDFESYNFGPWSPKVLDYSEILQDEKLIQVDTKYPKNTEDYCTRDMERQIMAGEEELVTNIIRVYSSSTDGIKVSQHLYKSLSQLEQNNINKIMRKYSNLPGRDLIEYVYKNYTDFTTKSFIKQDIIKSPLEEFKEAYPNLKVNSKFFQEKKLIGELLVERYID
jgi:hypothetical protein